HANSPRDVLARLETLVLMAGVDLPVRAIRQQVAGAINLICHLGRLRDGSRKVAQISEIVGMEQDIITMQDIFVLEQKGATPDGKVIAEFKPTGLRPKILDRIFAQGIPLPKEIISLFPPPPGYKPAGR
ncbi:MAG TPA: CpaF family protein, partial [Patescibacteria group bacterium]|nr:CpaF family protein [Patescibacteria group bacterium]